MKYVRSILAGIGAVMVATVLLAIAVAALAAARVGPFGSEVGVVGLPGHEVLIAGTLIFAGGFLWEFRLSRRRGSSPR